MFKYFASAAAAGQKTIYFTMVATGLVERNVPEIILLNNCPAPIQLPSPTAKKKLFRIFLRLCGAAAAGQKIIFFATVAAATVKRNASKKYKILHCRPGAAGRNRALGN